MSDVLALLKEMREELREIRLLYKELVERLMPVGASRRRKRSH